MPDEGACVELGIASAQKLLMEKKKMLIGLHTDSRAAFPDAKLNALVCGPLDLIVKNEGDLIAKVVAFKQECKTNGTQYE